MTKLSRVFALSFFVFFLSAPLVSALDIPKRPSGYVTDTADLISPQTEAQLEELLVNYNIQTSNQVVIATFPSLEGEALEDFSIRLAEAWKIGQKEKDNGVIFLIFKNDRKMRIEVGYGLEGAIPDALAGQIISQVVAPQFEQGNYEQGIISGIGAIMKAAQGEFQGVTRSSVYENRGYQRELTPEEMEALRKQSARFIGLAAIFFGILFFVDLFRYFGYRKDHRIYKDRYSFWEWFFRFAVMLAVISIIFRMLFYMALFSRGGYGGRGGGGGFSGGGGSFGGGGASGSW